MEFPFQIFLGWHWYAIPTFFAFSFLLPYLFYLSAPYLSFDSHLDGSAWLCLDSASTYEVSGYSFYLYFRLHFFTKMTVEALGLSQWSWGFQLWLWKISVWGTEKQFVTSENICSFGRNGFQKSKLTFCLLLVDINII